MCVSGCSLTGQTRDPLLEWLGGLPAGVEVVLDPGAIFAELHDDVRLRMLGMTSVWTGNAEESEALTGESDIVAAVAKAVEHLPDGAVAIVRDGPEGCAVHAGGESTDLDGYPQTAVDTNGAGDTQRRPRRLRLRDVLVEAPAGPRRGAISHGAATAQHHRCEIDAFSRQA